MNFSCEIDFSYIYLELYSMNGEDFERMSKFEP